MAPSETATAPRHATKGRGTLAGSPLTTQKFTVSHGRAGETVLNDLGSAFSTRPSDIAIEAKAVLPSGKPNRWSCVAEDV